MNYEEFCKNELVVSFIEDNINIKFPQEYAPDWINYDNFKTYLIEIATRELYDNIDDEYWWRCMVAPLITTQIGDSRYECFLDDCCYYEKRPEVPDNIKSLLD